MNFLPKNQQIMSLSSARQLNPVVLAYIGDAVYSLYVRSKLVETTDYKAHVLHKKCSSIVCATSQSHLADEIVDRLSEDELDVYRRARNSHVHTSAKNATLGDYMKATGLEAVVGYLYLTGQEDRLGELIGDLI